MAEGEAALKEVGPQTCAEVVLVRTGNPVVKVAALVKRTVSSVVGFAVLIMNFHLVPISLAILALPTFEEA